VKEAVLEEGPEADQEVPVDQEDPEEVDLEEDPVVDPVELVELEDQACLPY